MTATILKMPQASADRMQCSSCGATADAACDCGVPYVPVRELAAEGIKAGKSNRAIAAELNVSEGAVRKIRGAYPYAPEKRIGKDGKSYPAKARKRRSDEADDEGPEFTDADSYRAAILARVDSALTMARTATWAVENDPADVTKAVARELAQAVRNAAEAWCALADLLEKSL